MGERAKANLVWSFLLLDALALLLRSGSEAFVDHLLHFALLTAAFITLAWIRRPCKLDWRLAAIGALALVPAALQMAPLAEAWAPVLAPIKHRIVGEVNALFAVDLAIDSIAMTPANHLAGFYRLVMNLWLAWLAWRAPRPGYALVRAWLIAAGLVVGGLAAAESAGWLDPQGFLGYFHNTRGGVVNPNHFAAVAIAMLAFLFCDAIALNRASAARRWLRAAPNVLAAALLLAGLRDLYSRSATVLFIAACLFLAFYLARHLAAGRVSRFAGAGLIAVVAIAVLAPWSGSLRKFAKEGLAGNERGAVNRIGLAYLAEWPVLGTGLGSAATLLDPVGPRPSQRNASWRHFHNEYLEMTLEHGLAGAASLALMAWFLASTLRLRRRRRAHAALMGACWTMILTFAALSAMSFPLRVMGIQAFVFLFTALGAKFAGTLPVRSVKRSLWSWLIPLLAAALFFWQWREWRGALEQFRDTPAVQRQVRFDGFARAGFFAARQDFLTVVRNLTADEAGRQRIRETRARFHDYLREEPFNARALAMLFQLEIFEYRLDQRGFDRARFDDWKRRIKSTQALAGPHNHHPKLALVFLYQVYPENLNGAERRELAALEEEFSYLLGYAATANKKRWMRIAAWFGSDATLRVTRLLF